MSDLLFVYGTLRKDNVNPMAVLFARHASFVTDGWFQGKMYLISYYPGVVASDNQNDRVYGEIYRLNDPQKMLTVLDDYEECSTQHTHPAEYKRVTTNIHAESGGKLEQVWIYLYQWPLDGKAFIKEGDFMKISPVV